MRPVVRFADDDPIASFLLGPIERFIRMLHQFLQSLGVAVERSNSNTDRDLNLFAGYAIQHQRMGFSLVAYPFRQRDSKRIGRIGRYHQQFLSSIASHYVRLADRFQQQFSHMRQHQVAGLMPVRVVDAFEIIDIEHQN